MTTATPHPVPPESQHAGKYLTFRLGGEAYGVSVLDVREIIRPPEITTVPRMPRHIRGVINLRGRIIPVMDLRLRFDFPLPDNDQQTCIIVLQVRLPDGKQVHMGMVVDAVQEVAAFSAADLDDVPAFGGQIPTGCLINLAKTGNTITALLDMNQVVADTSTPATTTA